MSIAPQHVIRNVRRGPGTLEFDAQVAGVTRGLWVHTGTTAVPRADAVLPAALLPAMTMGGTLAVPGAVSPRLLRGVEEIQAVVSSWSDSWELLRGPLRHVEILPETVAESDVVPGERVAAFFSGGVDSFAAVLERPEVTDLIFVAGLDVPLSNPGRVAEIEAHLAAAASELGKRLIRVDTNVRQITDPALDWPVVFGSVLATIALCLAGRLCRVYIAGFETYGVLYPNGSHPLIDHHWAPEGLEIFHDNARFTRAERLARIAGDPVVRRRLRVCWQNADTALNCGVCEKCLCTMAPLAALGVLDAMETFPPLELGRLHELSIVRRSLLTFWRGNLALAKRVQAPRDLTAAIESVIRHGERRHRPSRRPWRR